MDHVEETRGQSTKKSLFTFRSGRLTASGKTSAARTNHAMTSPSLVKRICYPEVSRHHPSCLKNKRPERPKKTSNQFVNILIGLAKRAPHWGVQSRFCMICVCRGPKSVGGITWSKRAHAQSQYWAIKSDQ